MMPLMERIWRPLCQRYPIHGQISSHGPLRSLPLMHTVNSRSCAHILNIILHARQGPSSFTRQVDFTKCYLKHFCPVSKKSGPYVMKKFEIIDNQRCYKSTLHSQTKHRNRTVMLYVIAGTVLVVGFSYAAVPLYTVFCQATGLGGEVQVSQETEKVGTMSRVASRPVVIRFNADTAASMRWNFRPQQSEIKVYPGETALAFYSAINPTDKPIIGISTYNVVPFDAGQYFNKIQCFCFEEQRLNPHEQVDMPVFFFIDPEFAEDPKMKNVDIITLSYTFFEAKEGLVLPDPFAKP